MCGHLVYRASDPKYFLFVKIELKLRDFLRESRCRPRRPPPAVPIDAYFRESDQQSKVF